MQLVIIRHGETLWNKEGRVQGISDVELSTVGIEQARLLALSLKDHPISVIHTSPLKRALKTNEFQSSLVGNASKTIVNFQKDGIFIETFNDRSHLREAPDIMSGW
ncbi:MAG: histidine phosphatase family protein [Smithella sp.]|jgi:bisphosphoglycerate-dependent phosphoglycerate mutase|nr:hypothetical protein ER57_18035 [Smithella sp. SCADC]MDD5525144.1 histidine phosphatase family protein [Smithella sp.]HAR49448.1 histidine phosphatase family protein [Smithella sp.]